jgi:hypothetical protein
VVIIGSESLKAANCDKNITTKLVFDTTNKIKYVYQDWILNSLHNVVSSSKTLECSLPVFVVLTLPVAEIQRFFLCA